MANWTDSIVGDRMRVDQQFDERVRQSEFSNQEWGLVMTAVTFEIENADDPETARIVANTDDLPAIVPELKNVQSQLDAMGHGGTPDAGQSGGILDSLKGALGLGGNGREDERLEAAERLAQEYADRLQAHLESEGKWEPVRIAYLE